MIKRSEKRCFLDEIAKKDDTCIMAMNSYMYEEEPVAASHILAEAGRGRNNKSRERKPSKSPCEATEKGLLVSSFVVVVNIVKTSTAF